MKLGKFIGQKTIPLYKDNIDSVAAVITKCCASYFDGKLNIIYPADNNTLHTMTFEWILSHPIKKAPVYGKPGCNGDFVYNITKFTFLVWANIGYLENDPKKLPLISFDLHATTDGKYHTYRSHYDNDFKFEGVGHYMYNTNFNDSEFGEDFISWVSNIASKRWA